MRSGPRAEAGLGGIILPKPEIGWLWGPSGPQSMRGRILLILKFLLLVFGFSILIFIKEALPIISGYGCKIMCSGVFVAGRTPESVLKEDLGSFPLNLGTYVVDRTDSSVTGSVLGMATRV